jgi:hypothetical protein
MTFHKCSTICRLTKRGSRDRDLPRTLALEDRRRPVAVEREVGGREVVDEHHFLLAREVDEPLQVVELCARRGRVVRERREQITSSPPRRSSSFRRSTSANAYGGSASTRRKSMVTKT